MHCVSISFTISTQLQVHTKYAISTQVQFDTKAYYTLHSAISDKMAALLLSCLIHCN